MDHPWPPKQIAKGDDATALEKLKAKAEKGRIAFKFTNPENLRALVIQSLSELAKEKANAAGEGKKQSVDFHPINIIPNPPIPYIAHPYTLLQTKNIIGRQKELDLLTDWITTNKQVPADVRLYNVVAIGGMGKSALTWKWFNDIVPNELPKLAGSLWWSFYESDAYFENFIIRALAYVSNRPEEAIRKLTSPDREGKLFAILDTQPYLLVLDGLERILIAYNHQDTAGVADDELDDKTANRVAEAAGLPPSAADSFIGKHQLRLTADHRAGHFLRRLTRIRQSRILISTRLYPTELQAETGHPLPGCFAHFLPGLTDTDALILWREFKVTGSTEQLQPLFRSFGNYPLLIRALAGEVANFRAAPGNFDRWHKANPKFDPTKLSLINAKTHVLQYALQGLDEKQKKVLHTIAAFRMPATWETLRALLVDDGRAGRPWPAAPANDSKIEATSLVPKSTSPKPCPTEKDLDLILTELEDRGLVGWDRASNRYDLHPIVRAVVWKTLDPKARSLIHTELHRYFEALPKPSDWQTVESLEDLTPAIELYHTLIDLERHDAALDIFARYIGDATYFRLGNNGEIVILLERLFPDGIANPPKLQTDRTKSYTIKSRSSRKM